MNNYLVTFVFMYRLSAWNIHWKNKLSVKLSIIENQSYFTIVLFHVMIWFYQLTESQVVCVAGNFVGKHVCEITAKTCLLPLCCLFLATLPLPCSPTKSSAAYTTTALVGGRGNNFSTQGSIADDKNKRQKFKSN